jgi:dTDP-4-amino-4,6-dideoxyglucose
MRHSSSTRDTLALESRNSSIKRPKCDIAELALFGGQPTFEDIRYVGRPNTGDRDRFFSRLGGALDRRWLTNGGALVTEFEERVAALTGVRHCVATSSCTNALQVLIRAAGLTGDVLMPSMTFAGTAHAVRWLGLDPLFCDVDPDTANLDPVLVEAAITPAVSAILGVHLWGRPCQVDDLAEIADRHGIPLFFDAAHALGCTAGQRLVGGFGTAEVLSFHATKVVNTFEGGAIVTNDDALAETLVQLRNFGFGPTELRAGTNAKMSEAAAAMGLTSLEAMADNVAVNQDRYETYRDAVADLPGVELATYDPDEAGNYHYLTVLVDEALAGVSRDVLFDVLRAENVFCQRYFWPACHEREPYRTERPVRLPHTERLSAQVLTLPTGPAMSTADVLAVAELIRYTLSAAPSVRSRWQEPRGRR